MRILRALFVPNNNPDYEYGLLTRVFLMYKISSTVYIYMVMMVVVAITHGLSFFSTL